MNSKSKTYCSLPRRHGLTLIEVVVGVLLLATLLTGILLSWRRHARQVTQRGRCRRSSTVGATSQGTLWLTAAAKS